MIYVTGDTHGLDDFYKLHIFAGDHPELTLADTVLICGDCGIVWSDDTFITNLKEYKNLPFTIAFVDGNHENFDMLESFPVITWNGGKVHKIARNVFHLIRGEVFEIEGNRIFAFGGATSTDKNHRTTNISWWERELPTYADYDNAINNLEKYNFEVDYIITHTCDEKALYYPVLRNNSKAQAVFSENRMLSNFEEMVKYRHWYLAHFHINANITDKKTVLFDQIIKLGDTVTKEGEEND